jgi:hypothetical protein
MEIIEEVEDSKLDLSKPVSVAQMLALRQEQLGKYRLRIGCLASGILEDPTNKVYSKFDPEILTTSFLFTAWKLETSSCFLD